MTAGLGRSRLFRRFGGAVAALVLGATVAGIALGAGEATAASTSTLLSAAIPFGPGTSGATFYTADVAANVPTGATVTGVVLSSTADGTGLVHVDDRAVVTVNGGPAQTFNFYNATCDAHVPSIPAVAGFTAGVNNVHLEYKDVCGIRVGATEVYAVVTYTVPTSDPGPRKTFIEADSLVADVAGDGELLDVNLFQLSARLVAKASDTGGPALVPLEDKLVIFTDHGRYICRDWTDERGIARCSGVDKTLEGLVSYRATFHGDDDYDGSSDEASLVTVLNLPILPV